MSKPAAALWALIFTAGVFIAGYFSLYRLATTPFPSPPQISRPAGQPQP